ncbi:MAG: Rieske (2Fe-2S) protein [Ilumatobacter sp.]|nr:Rieske (2Fe-2S) protein [Ilumatobacter sp.]
MSTTTPTSESAPVAHLDDLAEGSMKLIRADGHRVCLVRTSSGVHAIDNACPHEGYGLTQGSLDGELLTCQWHNWKFRVSDGECVQGEEAVPVHDVDIDETGAVRVTINRPDPVTLIPKLMDSLRRGIERNYIGQVSRDVVRLLQAGADPAELVLQAVAHGAPRAEDGWGHSIASATDCLAMVELYDGDERALPIVQAIAGIAEVERFRPPNEPPPPADPSEADLETFRAAVDREDLARAQALLRAAIARGDGPAQLVPWFSALVADHHLSYGHGAIYGQKAFELLDGIGWEHADLVLTNLVPTIVYGTREDTLPYMRPFMKALGALDLDELAAVAVEPDWDGAEALVDVMLAGDRTAPVAAVEAALRAGAGVDRVLDCAVVAVSIRMLRYDISGERVFDDDFGWLDITHGLTYAHAARWHHARSVQAGTGTTADLLRLVMFTVFQAHWTGRHEWHTSVGVVEQPGPLDPDLAVAGELLQRESLLDGTSAFIVAAHAVKTSRAASREALRIGSSLPLDATLRFMRAPKLERFVAATVARSIDFLNGRIQRD